MLLIVASSTAFAHPGKTDYQDGHKCLKNCEDWDLYYDEYHLHDKDRNAIRMEGRQKSLKAPATTKKYSPKRLQQKVPAPVLSSPEPQTEAIAKRASNMTVTHGDILPVEDGSLLQFSDFLLFGIAVLLLLVLVLLRRKRERSYSRFHSK